MIKDELCGWLLLHRRGVMGTVIFHLVLAIAFLGVKISQADVHVEMEIVMEVPDEEEVEQQRAEEQRREEIRQRASGEEVERMLRSIAVNENIEAQSAQPMENISDYTLCPFPADTGIQMRVGRQGGGHDCSESPGDGGRCRSGAVSVRE